MIYNNMSNEPTKPKWKNGGKREGAGRRVGSKGKKTLEKEIILEEFRQRVLRSHDALIDAQMNLARGVSFLFRIDKETDSKGKETKSKPVVVTDPEEIASFLAGEFDDDTETYYYITTERPDNKALDSLFDRTHGKATQRTELTGKDGKDLPTPILAHVLGDNSNKESSRAK